MFKSKALQCSDSKLKLKGKKKRKRKKKNQSYLGKQKLFQATIYPKLEGRDQ
jgi:hypothetical protein